MAVSVALLCESFPTVVACERLVSTVDAEMVFQAAESEELQVAVGTPAGPNLVHPSCVRVPSVVHRVLVGDQRLEAIVACFALENFLLWLLLLH